MDELIKTVNKLQDAFSSAGITNPIDLPQIVVIGSQSSGKSSVLENIVGRDFLPRGSGIVTRRPLILQLFHTNVGDDEEWGEFLHLPNKKFVDFEKIKEEIVADTESKTGPGKGISPIPINLKIFSPRVLTLTLVDLPGLTKVPIPGQPMDIEKQIRELILKYISKSNAIILAATPANTDLANSDGLKLAREVDPRGDRTVGVLTKVDLMDQGTDVVPILSGKVIPLMMGYVPVVNRSQRDIDRKKGIVDALEAERQFFETHPSYREKARYCGTPFLTQKLSMVLMKHIRSTLPDIKTKITSLLKKYEADLASFGEGSEDGDLNLLLNIISDFCNGYRDILDGQYTDLSTTELTGGARISFVFHEIFANAIVAIDPFDQIKDSDIRTLVHNSSGSTPSLFVSGAGFQSLAKSQIKRLLDPSLKCVALVHDELLRILNGLLQKAIFKRFPALKERFYGSVTNFYKRCLDPTIKFVTLVVNSEHGYINMAHPDFLSGHKALSMVMEKMNNTSAKQSPGERKFAGGSTVYPISTESENMFGSFLSKKPGRKPGVLESPPQILQATGPVSEREYVEIEILKLLLVSYYDIVKKTISDMVPKAIMLNLVNYTKEEMQGALLADMYRKENCEELFKESELVASKRKECRKMVEALRKADEIVNTV